jgi:CO/xanthine dehydrogenase Mo-binding subunit
MAMDDDGTFLGLRVSTRANLGAYLSTFGPSVPTYLYATLLAGTYKTPAIYAEVKAMFTNTVPVDAYRGAGRPEASYLLERLVDRAAKVAGLDPIEIRSAGGISSSPRTFRTRHRSHWSTTSATTIRRSTRHWTSPTTTTSTRAGRTRPAAASCAVSAYRRTSKPAVSHRRMSRARWAPGQVCTRRARFVSIRPVPSR